MSIYDRFSEAEIEILKVRAERIAHAAGDDQALDTINGLSVSVNDETYVLPIETLAAIYEQTPVVPVPCTPDYVRGIANIRGHIVPVVDLGALLQMPVSAGAQAAALIVVRHQDITLAFQVDQVGDVTAVAKHQLVAAPFGQGAAQARYIQGILEDGAVLINVVALLEDPMLAVNAQQ